MRTIRPRGVTCAGRQPDGDFELTGTVRRRGAWRAFTEVPLTGLRCGDGQMGRTGGLVACGTCRAAARGGCLLCRYGAAGSVNATFAPPSGRASAQIKIFAAISITILRTRNGSMSGLFQVVEGRG